MSRQQHGAATGPLPLEARAFGLDKAAGKVKLVQTHIGWVYLAGPYAFKIKKPVKFDFLDFTTIAKRRWACEREMELNRRLCPDLYLGLCPVLRNQRGETRVDTSRITHHASRVTLVDWAVWMRRLPQERMLNELLEARPSPHPLPQGAREQGVTPADAKRIADVLAEFYLRQRAPSPRRAVAPSRRRSAAGGLRTVKYNVAENLREGKALDRRVLPAGSLKLIASRARYFLKKYGALIDQRAREGFVVDGHGDLRAENVWLPQTPHPQPLSRKGRGEPGKPLLFDCIEFNDRFRILDSALDVAFLAMDFDSRGREDLSRAFLARYMAACDPDLPPRLLNFYLGYRSFIKGKVEAWIAADPKVGSAQRAAALEEGRKLFDLAVRYALRGAQTLLVFCGVAGSGKSSLASEMARRLACPHIATDFVRDELVPRGAPPELRYAPDVSYRVYQTLYDRAATILQAGSTGSQRPAARGTLITQHSAVLDGTFLRSSSRKRAVQVARAAGARSILIWADCTAGAIAEHLRARALSGQLHGSEATLAISRKHLAEFEKPKPSEGFDAVCRIDTSLPLSECQTMAWDGVTKALAQNYKSDIDTP